MIKDRVGEVHGRLTVTADSGLRGGSGEVIWSCSCSCGGTVNSPYGSLKAGNTRSCGCLHREKTVARLEERNTKHGHSVRGSRTPTYRSWRSIFDRLNHDSDYAEVTIHPRYLDFQNFLEDVGERLDGTTIDRIDNSKGYEPGNLRWASDLVQANNRTNNVRITHDGETKTLAEWCRKFDWRYEMTRRKFHSMGKPEDFITQYQGLRGEWDMS